VRVFVAIFIITESLLRVIMGATGFEPVASSMR